MPIEISSLPPFSSTVSKEETFRYHEFLDNVPTIFFSLKAVESWPVEYVSKNIEQLGYSAEMFLTGSIDYTDIIFEDDLQRVTKEVEYHTKNNKDKFHQVYRIVSADNEIRWVNNNATIERNKDGSVENYIGIVTDITDQKLLQKRLLQSEENCTNITENSQVGIFIYQNNKIIYTNKAFSKLLGYPLEELYAMNVWELAHDSNKEKVKDIVIKRSRGDIVKNKDNDFKFITKTGDIKTFRVMANTIFFNSAYAGFGTVLDITDIIDIQKKFELLAHAVEQTDDFIRITKKDGTIIFVNDSVVKHSGYERTELIGQKPNIFKSGEHDEVFYKNIWSTILNGDTFYGVFVNKKKNGHLYYEQETITPINEEEGSEYFVVTGKDISERVKKENELYSRANIDSLTGIYNRQNGSEQLDLEINRYKRYRSEFALIMLDIDNFKDVNDNYGHDMGDEILKKMCKVISKKIRKSDIFFRWGGEEFMIIVPNLGNNDAIKFAEKLREAVSLNNFDEIGHITISLGVSFPKYDDTKEDLLKRVDKALYLSKNNGRNQVSIL